MAKKSTQRRMFLRELGFLEDPFMSSADPRFLYLSTQHGNVLDRCTDAIEDFRGLAVIDGSFGVGKSSLALRLESIYRGLPDQYKVIYIHTASYESEYAGLQDMCDAVKLPRRKGLTKQWREFENFLVDQHGAGRNVVIILDDAQLLQPPALTLIHTIYNFDKGGRKLAQVVLFGQEELHNKFAMFPEIRSRINQWWSLNPLSPEDTIELVRFRCQVAGRDDPLIPSQSGFLDVYEVTQGIPRQIVNLCSHIVEILGAQKKTSADSAVIEEAIKLYQSSRPLVTTLAPRTSNND